MKQQDVYRTNTGCTGEGIMNYKELLYLYSKCTGNGVKLIN